MLIRCKECGGKSRITSRHELSVTVADLYCQCLAPGCGHQFVMTLAYARTTRPAGPVINQLLVDHLRQLPATEQRQLFESLNASCKS